ncbi:MAG: trypsin-like peptidase domain-containing protein [Candidatus Yanofskybacteria bacterium]|nr:trypsin-like peptidase domain-containing protein [Candidatus Yanofskybacteria bacterium]
MKLKSLVVLVVLSVFALVVLSLFDERSKIKYPSGITIVQIIGKFQDGLTGEYFDTSSSGFFIDNKYIATNNHAVELVKYSKRQRAEITIFDGKDTHPARIVGLDSDTDVALLEPLSWCDIKIQRPCSRSVGERDMYKKVIVYPHPPSMSLIRSWFDYILNPYPDYGNPNNRLRAQVLRGYITGFEDWIGLKVVRHLSGIVPGYSGTPLLDSNSCYVGMNFRYDRLSLSLSYAISNEDLQQTFREIREYGYVRTAFLGLAVSQGRDGVYVLVAVKNGPTEILDKYGVQAIELKEVVLPIQPIARLRIHSVNGTEVRDIKGLWTAIKDFKSGEIVRMIFKDSSGNVYEENIKLVSRFHFLQKYSLVELYFEPTSEQIAII